MSEQPPTGHVDDDVPTRGTLPSHHPEPSPDSRLLDQGQAKVLSGVFAPSLERKHEVVLSVLAQCSGHDL